MSYYLCRSVLTLLAGLTGSLLAQTSPRLTIVNGCDQPMWIFSIVGAGGGTFSGKPKVQLAQKGDSIVYQIPDKGLAGTRFWPGLRCDANGDNCGIGESGGAAGMVCSAKDGCAPPIDSKFEGTFGCLPTVPAAQCQINPSSGSALPPVDGWDTSNVDGYTLPYTVQVSGNCPGGPSNNRIDCSKLQLANCPATEDLSSGGAYPALKSVNLTLSDPPASFNRLPATVRKSARSVVRTEAAAGCFSPCGKLTFGDWQSLPNPPFTGTTYQPGDPQAKAYCCPTPPYTPEQCRTGPVVSTAYVQLIHGSCPQSYAYGYDDVVGNFACPAAANLSYTVTFFCPN